MRGAGQEKEEGGGTGHRSKQQPEEEWGRQDTARETTVSNESDAQQALF